VTRAFVVLLLVLVVKDDTAVSLILNLSDPLISLVQTLNMKQLISCLALLVKLSVKIVHTVLWGELLIYLP